MTPETVKLLISNDPLKDLNDYQHEIEMIQAFASDKNILDCVNENLKTLKEGHSLYHGDCYGFLVTKNYLQRLGYIVKEIDISGNSGCDTIDPLSLESIYKILNRVEANEIEN